MGKPVNFCRIFRHFVGNSVNWNILIAEGRESKSDFLISGELNENSLNPLGCSGGRCNASYISCEIVDYNTKEGWKSCNMKFT